MSNFNPCEGLKPSQGLVAGDSVNILPTAARDNRSGRGFAAPDFVGFIFRGFYFPGRR
jgi:hypothetical protein